MANQPVNCHLIALFSLSPPFQLVEIPAASARHDVIAADDTAVQWPVPERVRAAL